MPSKGRTGRSQAQPLAEVLAAAVGQASASSPPVATAMDTAPVTPTHAIDLNRPLQRDTEVARFHDLVARQDSLSGEESEELRGLRERRLLTTERRLQRHTQGSNEAEIVATLDEYRRRLAALRHFDEAGAEAGLGGSEAVDSEDVRRAVDRLHDLQLQRPRGLISGSGEAPRQEANAVRISSPAFAPAQDDVELLVVVSPTTPHEHLQEHLETLREQGARIRFTTDPADAVVDGPPSLVINWGSDRPVPQGLVALNRPDAVRTSSDQVECLRRLAELAPRTVTNPQDLELLGTDRVVAKRRGGMRGRGKRVLEREATTDTRAGYDLFQEYLPHRQEYRLVTLSGRVVSAHLRRPPEGAQPDDLSPAWSYERLDTVPGSVARVAREAANRVGLDLAGVDVVEDLDTGRVMCLEANSAPGMSAETLRSLYSGVQQQVHGRLRRAG
jgi:hypothetical protein